MKRWIAEQPAPAQENAKARWARKRAVFLMALGVSAWALGGTNLWLAMYDRESQRLLEDRSVPATATVVKRLIAPDGRTHRIHYRVNDAGGQSAQANVEVQPDLWESLEVGETVEVFTVAGRPDISQLVAGQVLDRYPAPGARALMALAIILLGILFVASGVMNWREVGLGFQSPRPNRTLKPRKLFG